MSKDFGRIQKNGYWMDVKTALLVCISLVLNIFDQVIENEKYTYVSLDKAIS